MDGAGFKASLDADGPPAGLSPPLEALWWSAKGDWSESHKVVQQHEDRDCAWVHAFLHRVEGDLANAKYWYRRAGRRSRPHPQGWRAKRAGCKVETGPLDAERDAMIAALL